MAVSAACPGRCCWQHVCLSSMLALKHLLSAFQPSHHEKLNLSSSFKAIIITHKQLEAVIKGAVLHLFCREERKGWYFTSTISKLLVLFWKMFLLQSMKPQG